MERFRQYKEYKDSGLIWLGRVPIHWKPMKINHFTEIVSERNHPKEELLSVYRDYGVIKKESRDDNHNKPGENLSNYKLVKPGYLVLNKMKTWQGSLGISEHRGIVSPAYITCKLTESNIYPPFLHYALRCSNYVFEYNRISYGVRTDQWDMRYDEFKNIPVFFPTVEEQKAIATFLNHKTAQIAHYIQLKEKTIALLEERKAAIINQAVTRGLDPDAPMKDSGIEWLGEIPEGWIVKKLKWNSKTTSGGTPPSGNREDFYNGDIPWIRTTDLNNNELFDVPEKVTSLALKYTACKIVPENTVCVAMYGGPGTIGKHSIIRFSGTVNQALCAILPSPDIIPDYLYYYLKFYRPIWMINAKGSRVDPNISQDEVRNMIIPYPSSREQSRIVKHIEFNCDRIDGLISKNEKEITLIKEYRESLISAAVTGKIDVREYQQTASEYAAADNN